MTHEQEMIFKPEPVAEVQTGTIRWHIDRSDLPNGTKLYAHPAPVAAPAPDDARDAARLDWLNSHGWAVLLGRMRFRNDVRAAIDAAMKEKP